MLNPNIVRNLPKFGAKNPDTRKADDVMRASKLEFPAFSPNYAYYYYKCAQPESKNYKKSIDILSRLSHEVRNVVRGENKKDIDKPKVLLDNVKHYKLAHCYEKTLGLMAYMKKEGYKGAMPVALGLTFEAVDKTTGETVFESEEPMDHVVLLTNMGNKDRYYIDDLVVIDPWLDFAGSVSEARARYAGAFQKKIYEIRDQLKPEIMTATDNSKNLEIRAQIDFYEFKLKEEEKAQIKNYFAENLQDDSL